MAAALCVAGAAHALNWQSGSGDWTLSWDTTIGYGQAWRVKGLDCRLIAMANGGCGYSPNIDNGDLNFPKKAAFSEALTGVTELALNYRDRAGAFLRADGLYDFEVMENNDTRRVPLSHEAKNLVGSRTRLLDAFGYWRFDLGTMPSELRLGRQVVSWGESTFIQNGLNQVNHFDVSALRVPGAELRQALLPDDMAVLNMQLSKNLSGQLLYLFDWHETLPEPAGSYFSTNDFGTPGGRQVFLGFGAISDQGVDFRPLGGPVYTDFQAVNRLPDQKPPDSGQYGANLKVFLPNFSDGTQLGFYFLNYTSRLPVVSSVTGTPAGFANSLGALNAVGGAAQLLAAGVPFAAAVAGGAAAGQAAAAKAGGNLSATLAQQYATIGANTLLAGGNVNNQAANLATYEYGKSAGYFEEFPQDIKLLGISFNTELKRTGTALQGEVTYRHGVPLQLDDVELLYASLTPFESGVAQALGQPVTAPGNCQPKSATPITGCNQLGAFGLGQTIQGWKRKDMWQGQFTATQIFSNVLRASQAVVLLEAAVDYFPGLEDKYSGGPVGRGLRYDGPGTNLSGNPELGGYPEFPGLFEPGSAFATRVSYGYVLAGRLEYNNLIAAWNVLPHFTWAHDVHGTSPGPGGNFVEGRHALTLGIGANLRAKWDLDVSYTQYGGAGQYNLLRDRDFVAASIKYSF
ncbi:MAG: DUF1302 domain-containing protein [Gammaproteobacteria bacterium]|nr:DUF1302 domain-containing protein [Gammaproteobacteria bacterium]MBV9622340.1 DUF1302 domain-containing protein [Gammaproteobacteria bacterium]